MTSDIPHPLIWLYGNYVASAARRGNRDGDKGAFYKKSLSYCPSAGHEPSAGVKSTIRQAATHA